MKANYIYVVLGFILMVSLLYAQQSEPEILFPDHHLCLEASGRVVLAADQAIFSFESRGFGPSLREAVNKAKNAVSSITAELIDIGIDETSFATGSFASGKNPESFFLSDKKDFSATLNTIVTLRDLTKLDEAILILTDKKVQNLSGIRFALSDQSHARQQAREIALNRIAEQRETIERILGIKIIDVQLIDEAPFEKLPWDNGMYYPSKGNYPNAMNSVTNYDQSGALADQSQSGGFYSPETIVETQVRVIYRIGLIEAK